MYYEISPSTVRLMSFKNLSYNVIIDEVDSADYRYEATRLESFKNWPIPYIKPEKLAAAGFYFTGELDIVRCFECGTETYKWQEGDEPMVDHTRQSPTCRFVCNTSCNNIPVDEVPGISIVSPISESRDVCGSYKYDSPSDYYNFYPTNSSSIHPKYPEYKPYEIRFRTFESWSSTHPSLKQTPKQLSLAGFYYTGRGDQVLCFHCGVGVKDWEPNDDPWEQHAIWYPNCKYLLDVKGSKYVEEITGRTISSRDLQTTSCVAKVEQSISNADWKTKHMKFAEEDFHLPGPSSQSSQGSDDSAIESISSNNSSIKGSKENLSDVETESYTKPISDTRICKICFDAEISQLFLPCGHLVACVDCAKCVNNCPMCRQPLTGQMKVFFS